MTRIGKNSHIYLDFNDYTEGFKPLDTQHRNLVIQINQIADLIFSDDIDFKQLLIKINKFEKAAVYHFGFEQEMMIKMDYEKEAQAKHEASHGDAIKVVRNIKEMCEYPKIYHRNIAFKYGSEIIGWFKSHEREYDHPMISEFKKYLDATVQGLKQQNP